MYVDAESCAQGGGHVHDSLVTRPTEGVGKKIALGLRGVLCFSVDMGIPLFLDIVRSLHPSHIIRLLYKQQRTVESVRELCPLTSELLKSTPGLVTKARMEGVTAHVRGGEGK